ncbi:MAG: hypothetical protein ACYSTI_13225 [Planctomycetota bacterium]|jgi:hypothetical protein
MSIVLQIEDQSTDLGVEGIHVDAFKKLGDTHMNPDVKYGEVSMYMGPWQPYIRMDIETYDDILISIAKLEAEQQQANAERWEEMYHDDVDTDGEAEDSDTTSSTEDSTSEVARDTSEGVSSERADRGSLAFIPVNGKVQA